MSKPQGGGDVRSGIVFVRCVQQIRAERCSLDGVFMPRADGDYVQSFRRREQGTLRSLLSQRLEDRPLALSGRGLLQVESSR